MAEEEHSESTSNRDPGRSVTLRDIARELGVSHVTVSLALRDHPRISAATKTRVKKKAAEMDYHPDPMLSALSHYRLTSKEKPKQAQLAWLNPLKDPKKLLQNEEFRLYWEGANEIALKLGFGLEEFYTEELSLHRMDTIFKTRNIRGVIIAPLVGEVTPLNWDDFPWKDYAVVRLGRGLQGPLAHYVTSAQVSNTVLAYDHITQMGYKHIAFVGNSSKRRMFLAGYTWAQAYHSSDQFIPPLLLDENKPDEHQAIFMHWMKTYNPDAIITDNNLLLEWLKDMGRAVPDNVGIITTSIHDTPINAGIDQNPLEIGRSAIRLLVSLMNEHHFGIPDVRTTILVEGRWVEGSMLPNRIP
ncbi:LacI family DNA-binding transcriptional regulator [Pontiellaceae bacterium B12219]|nr:LacI family DNA-binding transcriptional regulator [Pontiellaceae bacterium B12219]